MSKDTPDIVLFSDGGGESASTAGAACIVEDTREQKRYKLTIWLDGATNNESEIMGGLLGFSLARCLIASGAQLHSVKWVCDSEYVLKSATGYINTWQRNGWKTANKKPVKNQGLWRAYLWLSAGLEVVAQHVKGHSGHKENEVCDSMVGWVRADGPDILAAANGRAVIDPGVSGAGPSWLVVDGVDFLQRLRTEEPDEADFRLLEGDIGLSLGFEVKEKKSAGSSAQLGLFGGGEQDSLVPAVWKLRQALDEVLKVEGVSGRAAELRRELERLLKKFG